MAKLYKLNEDAEKVESCKCDPDQVAQMASAGWTRDPSGVVDSEFEEVEDEE